MLSKPLLLLKRRKNDGLFFTLLLLDRLRSSLPILRPSQGTLWRPSGLLVWSRGMVFMMRTGLTLLPPLLSSLLLLVIRLTTWTCWRPVMACGGEEEELEED